MRPIPSNIKSSILGLQVHRNVCLWIMSMMELWSGLEEACKLLKTLFIFNQKYIWTRVTDYNNLNLN